MSSNYSTSNAEFNGFDLYVCGITGLVIGSNEFEWTISNGVCPPSIDTVAITNTGGLTTPDAGPDQGVSAYLPINASTESK